MQDKYSYMRDMYSIEEIENINDVMFINDTYWKKRTVNGISYRDPDYNCDKLYNDINTAFFRGKLEKSFDPNNKNQIVLLENNYRLTSDYMGPSLTSMKRAGIPDKEAWKYTVECRILGGHMVWPRMRNGINPSKAASGKKGCGISDRADIALYEIKCVLDHKKDMPIYNTTLRDSILREENMKWFNGISFSEFCKMFYLINSFVDKNYEINWMADPCIGQINETIMRSYMKNNMNLIKKRDTIITNHITK